MQLPPWLVALLIGLAVLAPVLAAALYSVRAQRASVLDKVAVRDLQELLPAIQSLSGGWLVPGNHVELLENGNGFFPRLLADIAAARRHVNLESYVWWRGDICRRLAQALSERARAGVEVRLTLDAIGSWTMDPTLAEGMQAAGCRLLRYHDFRFRTFGRLNKRTHRKLAVVDGSVAYVFSHGIAAEWEGNGDGPRNWRDIAARLRGPIVHHVQSVFFQNWMEESGEVPAASDFFPPVAPIGSVDCQVVSSSPRGGVSRVSLLLRLLFAAAQEEILIQCPYFAPSDAVIELLEDAAKRGVRVRLMVPGKVTDSRLSQFAGRYRYQGLLRAGVEILEHQVTLLHQKTIVVDGRWSHLGSTNLDERSFDINAEVSLGVLDSEVATSLRQVFQRDEAGCRPVELASWSRRPRRQRLIELLAHQLHYQL